MKEIWKPIEDFSEKYEISNLGEIRNKKTKQEAYNDTNVCMRNILQVINHEEGRKQAGGYIWKCEREVNENVDD